jgi:hypothetical protein
MAGGAPSINEGAHSMTHYTSKQATGGTALPNHHVGPVHSCRQLGGYRPGEALYTTQVEGSLLRVVKG